MAICAGILVAGEFLPVSLLSPIAQDFDITEGRAGQAISISGLFAVLTSLTVVPLTVRIDRRHVVAGFVAALALSCVIAGFATDFPLFLLGRALVGIAVGGFWTFSTATVMRLLPPSDVPAGLAFSGRASRSPRPSRPRSQAFWARRSAGGIPSLLDGPHRGRVLPVALERTSRHAAGPRRRSTQPARPLPPASGPAGHGGRGVPIHGPVRNLHVYPSVSRRRGRPVGAGHVRRASWPRTCRHPCHKVDRT